MDARIRWRDGEGRQDGEGADATVRVQARGYVRGIAASLATLCRAGRSV